MNAKTEHYRNFRVGDSYTEVTPEGLWMYWIANGGKQMAEHSQIDISKGKQLVRIHSGWGVPKEVLPTLRKVATMGRKTPQSIAEEFIRQLPDASFGLSIIAEDFQRDALNFYYTVDVSTNPWKVVQETCEGYRIIDNGDGTGSISPTITPARKRTLFIKTMAAVVE